MFGYFKKRRENKKRARSLYALCVTQARSSAFYDTCQVPDSVDGRFEMIALHCYLLMHEFNAQDNKKMAQALFDVFFKNMDLSIREMGVGDLSVPKHMRRMMKGFNGRATSYEEALTAQDDQKLQEALVRNVYGTVTAPKSEIVTVLRDYVRRTFEALRDVDLVSHDPVFPSIVIGQEQEQERKRA